jgi:rfaE bifunctional protein kinase chain/domain
MTTLTNPEIEKSKGQLLENLAKLEGRKILVVGDVGLDEYLSGDVKRISPEAPVPVIDVKAREYRVGLAANVAQNIHSLGGVSLLVGLVGNDSAAKDLGSLLKTNGVSEQNLVTDGSRPTTRKVRVMSGQHHMVRIDFEERKFLDAAIEAQLIKKIEGLLPSLDGVILQDYGKGVLSENLCQKLIQLSKQAGKPVLIDPHRTTPVRYYRGADLIKPNRDEAFILSGLNIDDAREKADTIIEVGEAITKQTGAKSLVITSGREGVYLFSNGAVTRVPTTPRQVYDVTGAGDTYLAALALGWLSGFSLPQSAVLANAAAGVVVGKIGSVPCTRAELEQALKD